MNINRKLTLIIFLFGMFCTLFANDTTYVDSVLTTGDTVKIITIQLDSGGKIIMHPYPMQPYTRVLYYSRFGYLSGETRVWPKAENEVKDDFVKPTTNKDKNKKKKKHKYGRR